MRQPSLPSPSLSRAAVPLSDRDNPQALLRPDAATLATVFAVLLLGTVIACASGFTTPDSWHYLFLAQSLRHGLGCTEQGAYYAIFPCGYPLAIALVSPASDIASLLIGSKIANLALLYLTFVLLARSPVGTLGATLVALNPVTLHIFQYTWSENLFLFAFAGTVAALCALHRGEHPVRHAVLLAAALITGCASRYVFGPFAALLFVCVVAAWGWRTALRALPSFVAAAAFYAAYQWFNAAQTGFGTGMARIAAPESVRLLGYAFVWQFVVNAASFVLPAIALLVLCGVRRVRLRLRLRGEDRHSDAARSQWFLVFAGLGFLALQFVLRLFTQFDLYGARTIGHGIVLLFAGLAGLFLRTRRERAPIVLLVCYGLVVVLIAQGAGFARSLARLPGSHVTPVSSLQRFHALPNDAELVVNLMLPRASATMEGTPLLYYPRDKTIVTPSAAPYARAETFAEFRARVLAQKSGHCVIDFTPFANADLFKLYVKDAFPIDVKLHANLADPEWFWRYRLDPSLQDYLLARFEPGRYVDCAL